MYKGAWHRGDVAPIPQVIGSCFRDNTSTQTPDSQAKIHLWVNKILFSFCLCDHTSKRSGNTFYKICFSLFRGGKRHTGILPAFHTGKCPLWSSAQIPHFFQYLGIQARYLGARLSTSFLEGGVWTETWGWCEHCHRLTLQGSAKSRHIAQSIINFTANQFSM